MMPLSFMGLLSAPAVYQAWIVERWLDDWNNPLLNYMEQLVMTESNDLDIFMPVKLALATLLAPTIPAFLRMKTLGMNRLWIAAALLPGVNLLFFAYLSSRSTGKADRPTWPQLAAAAGLLVFL